MKALVTGVTGFAGSHLAEHLLTEGYDVYGTFRHRSPLDNIAQIHDRLKLVECELTDPFNVQQLIEQVEPELVFHLAAQSFVTASWRSPQDTIVNNISCQLNLFEAIRAKKINPKFLVVGSSEEYGQVRGGDFPITEAIPLKPLSPYGVSKVAQDLLGYQYCKTYEMNIIRSRAFNHTGPRRGEVFVTSNFASQIAQIEMGLREPVIKVGNLEAERDFTDVRDTVRAYLLILKEGRVGDVYNIASGKARTIQSVLDMLLSHSKVDVRIEVDESRLRPSDLTKLEGSFDKIRNTCGWEPEIPFEKTLSDLLNYWRERIKRGYKPSMQRF